MKICGKIALPGDKSISHRALLVSALAEGSSCLKGLNLGADLFSTQKILKQLGVGMHQAGADLIVQGTSQSLATPQQVLNCGNSGTTMRLVAGILAAQDFTSILDGDLSLRVRPMARIIEPLGLMGAKIKGEQLSTAPLVIQGTQLLGINYQLPVASAQVKSALLFAGLQAEGETIIQEPVLTRNHTELMFDYCGVPIKHLGTSLSLSGGSFLQGQVHQIPGDFSSAAYLIGAALGLKNSELIITDVGLNPTRLGFFEVLQEMGAKIEIIDQKIWGGEPVGDLVIRGSELVATKIQGPIIPRLIDEIPILAVLATQASGTTVIADAGELRYKESDRLSCLAQELSKLGAKIQEQLTGLKITGPTKLKGAKVNSHGDHRLALALEVAALFAEGSVEIAGKNCGEISYPGFSRDLGKLIGG